MFIDYKKEMQESFDKMVAGQTSLYTVVVDKDVLWNAYLLNFDESVRQEHNCSCCRHFIKHYGSIVAIKDGKIVTFWDFETSQNEYKKSTEALRDLILSSRIENTLVQTFPGMGTDKNYDPKLNTTWNHLYYKLDTKFITSSPKSIDTLLSQARDIKHVFSRSLEEITPGAVNTVLGLISDNSLYRGQEFEAMVKEFGNLQKQYLNSSNKELFIWENSKSASFSVTKIKNSAIGTLLIDLSEGKDVEKAVSAFEKMVAPLNYKRPTPIVTQAMIETAEKTVNDLGIKQSLIRKFATSEEISINDLLFVDRNKEGEKDVFDSLKENIPVNPRSFSKSEEVTVEEFMNNIVPTATSIEVLFENEHSNNLMSIIGPTDKDAPNILKWNNPFSWHYTNAVTDSLIKERVKAAGGNVVGELRVSLSWSNYDDLDIHIVEPGRNRIYYGDKTSAISGAKLDVDMNARVHRSRTPVENIIFPDSKRMREGVYRVEVNNFTKRENKDVGFTVEIESRGEVRTFDFDKNPSEKETKTIVEIHYSRDKGAEFVGASSTPSKVASNIKWNIGTNKFHKVRMITNSPNHWNNQIGNKHLFFILENAKNDEVTRPFFNEFLKDDLLEQKRVFELLGSKLVVPYSDEQLSGLGFSSTQRNHLICKINGIKTIKVNF